MKKAAIFDLDGTLSDSIMSMKYSGDKTMAEFGYDLSRYRIINILWETVPPIW